MSRHVLAFDIQQEQHAHRRRVIPTRVEVSQEVASDENDAFPELVYFGHYDQFENLELIDGESFQDHDHANEVLATPAKVADFENPHDYEQFMLYFRMQDIDFSEVEEGSTDITMGIGVPLAFESDSFEGRYYIESTTHRIDDSGYSTSFSGCQRELDDDDD